MPAERFFGIEAERLCRIRTGGETDQDPFPLDADGFLDPLAARAASSGRVEFGSLVTPEVAASRAALVLLGEPGIGKSTIFDQLTARSTATVPDGSGIVVRVDGGDLTRDSFQDELGQHLARLPLRGMNGGEAVDRGLAAFTVVIDQLDESPMIRRFDRELRRSLDGRDVSALRLMIACRATEFGDSVRAVLADVFPHCVVADLAPLTRAEAVRLVDSLAPEGEALVSAAVDVGAGALASIPLTLEMLVRVHRDLGALPHTAAETFSQAVVHLCDEPSRNRVVETARTSVGQRVAIAGRIAAGLLLSGRRTIWCGATLHARETDVSSEAFAGGREEIPAGWFEVEQTAVRETLSTALFTARGADRLAFRHSSLAAFLAARYLAERRVPEQQLRCLFLVGSSDDSRGIPDSLRETAAWLATLDPDTAVWLAAADPESLAGHSAIVDSAATRRLVVQSLLARAPEVQVGPGRWAFHNWKLDHPGLEAQLRPFLEPGAARAATDWETQSRVWLAVQIAKAANCAELAPALLPIAENPEAGAYLRLQAASAAAELQPDMAITRLRAVLETLAEPEPAAALDPDDELRGGLLHILWPSHLSVDDAVRFLRPRRNRHLTGAYAIFLRMMPGRTVSEEMIDELVRWASEQIGATGIVDTDLPIAAEPLATVDQAPLPAPPSSGLDSGLLDSLIERALTGAGARARLAAVAHLVEGNLDEPQTSFPVSLDVLENGVEPDDVRELRRLLAVEMMKRALRRAENPAYASWRVMHGWSQGIGSWLGADGLVHESTGRTRLVDKGDFEWMLARAAEEAAVNELLARSIGALAAALYDPADTGAIELAFASQDNPAWEFLRGNFDEVAIGGEDADRMRAAHRSSQFTPREPPPWPGAAAHQAQLLEHLAAARDGDATAFVQLAFGLEIDAERGVQYHRVWDDPVTLPGLALLPEEGRQDLLTAAIRFLESERDDWREWLTAERAPGPAWAGYLALCLLGSAGELTSISDSAWEHWCGSIVFFSSSAPEPGGTDRRRVLLGRAAAGAPTELGEAAIAHLIAQLQLGSPLVGLDVLVEAVGVSALAEGLCSVANLVSGTLTGSVAPDASGGFVLPATPEASDRALDSWEHIVRLLLRGGDQCGEVIARDALGRPFESDEERRLATRAGLALHRESVPSAWSAVESRLDDEAFGQMFAVAISTNSMFGPLIIGNEDELVRQYRWLAGLYPPDRDPAQPGGILSADQQVRMRRDMVLQMLAAIGSDQALRALVDLAREFPSHVAIVANLARARAALSESSWSPPAPNAVLRLLGDASRRLVRSEAELLSVVLEALDAIANDLDKHCELLWDRIPARHVKDGQGEDLWCPKLESALSAYLTHELQLRLAGRSVVVNREVLVKPTDAYGAGERTDIKVEAVQLSAGVGDPALARADVLTVVIENKGCWNATLETDLRSQLADRYLPECGTTAGAYVVGWYPLELWTDTTDRTRRQQARRRDLEVTTAELEAEAESLRQESQLVIRVVPLRVPRPNRPQPRTRQRRDRTSGSGTAESPRPIGLAPGNPPSSERVAGRRRRPPATGDDR